MGRVIAALNLLGDFTHGRESECSEGGGGRASVTLWAAEPEHIFSAIWKRLSYKYPPHLQSGLAQKPQDAEGIT